MRTLHVHFLVSRGIARGKKVQRERWKVCRKVMWVNVCGSKETWALSDPVLFVVYIHNTSKKLSIILFSSSMTWMFINGTSYHPLAFKKISTGQNYPDSSYPMLTSIIHTFSRSDDWRSSHRVSNPQVSIFTTVGIFKLWQTANGSANSDWKQIFISLISLA